MSPSNICGCLGLGFLLENKYIEMLQKWKPKGENKQTNQSRWRAYSHEIINRCPIPSNSEATLSPNLRTPTDRESPCSLRLSTERLHHAGHVMAFRQTSWNTWIHHTLFTISGVTVCKGSVCLNISSQISNCLPFNLRFLQYKISEGKLCLWIFS